MSYLWVGVGSAAGGIARFAFATASLRWFGMTFPWGTLVINVAGSLLIGMLAVTIPPEGRLFGTDARALLIVGLCGGFTTFSAFSLESLTLIRSGDWTSAAFYALGSVVLCLVAVAAGYAIASALAMR